MRLPLPRALFAALVLTMMTAGIAPATLLGPVSAAGDCTVGVEAALDAEERQFLVLINQHRAANGRAPLTASYYLSRAAQWKSSDMGINRYFAHDDLGGRAWWQRIQDCNYTYGTSLGENIAAGNSTAAATFLQWRNSAGHNANMLSPDFTAIGIGRAYAAGSPYGWYWTTEFGGVNDGWASMQPAPGSVKDRTHPPKESNKWRGHRQPVSSSASTD